MLTAGAAKEAWPVSVFALQVLSNGEGVIDDLAVIFDDWHLTHKRRSFCTLHMPAFDNWCAQHCLMLLCTDIVLYHPKELHEGV